MEILCFRTSKNRTWECDNQVWSWAYAWHDKGNFIFTFKLSSMNSKINSIPINRFLGVELCVRKTCIFTHDIWWLEDLRWLCSNLSSIAVSEFRRVQIWFRDAKTAKYTETSTGSTIFWMQQLLLLFHIHIFKKYRKLNHKLNANYCKRKVSTWKLLLLRKL